MESFDAILDVQEAIVDAFGAKESRLSWGDEGVYDRGQPHRHDFGNKLGDGVDQTNRPIITNGGCPIFFW